VSSLNDVERVGDDGADSRPFAAVIVMSAVANSRANKHAPRRPAMSQLVPRTTREGHAEQPERHAVSHRETTGDAEAPTTDQKVGGSSPSERAGEVLVGARSSGAQGEKVF